MEIDQGDEPRDGPQLAQSSAVARGFSLAANILAAVGTLWILALMGVIVADVVGRNLLDRPITGVAETAGHSVVAIVFLQLTSAVLAGRMTRADFVARIIAGRAPWLGRLLDALFALVGALVFAAIIYASWPDLSAAWTRGEFFGVPGVFTVPTWPFRAIIVLGSAGAMVAYLGLAFGQLLGPARETRA